MTAIKSKRTKPPRANMAVVAAVIEREDSGSAAPSFGEQELEQVCAVCQWAAE
jgi:hypothetical protein